MRESFEVISRRPWEYLYSAHKPAADRDMRYRIREGAERDRRNDTQNWKRTMGDTGKAGISVALK